MRFGNVAAKQRRRLDGRALGDHHVLADAGHRRGHVALARPGGHHGRAADHRVLAALVARRVPGDDGDAELVALGAASRARG